MKLKKALILLFLLPFMGSLPSFGQKFAISNNLLYDASGILSAGIEMPLWKKTSFEVYGGLRPWKRSSTSVHKSWEVQAQYRIWPCQVMNGLFIGPYAHYSQFNFGNTELCFGLLKGLKPHRYEGWLVGGGIGAGYEYALAKHWNIGAELGVGYTYIKYDKYNCEICGSLKGSDDYNYIGISKLGLSLIYIF